MRAMSKTLIEELYPDAMLMDGYDECIVGAVERFGMNPIICYDKNKIIKSLETDGMSNEEANEWFEFNQIGAWVGDGTPCFLDTLSFNKQIVDLDKLDMDL